VSASESFPPPAPLPNVASKAKAGKKKRKAGAGGGTAASVSFHPATKRTSRASRPHAAGGGKRGRAKPVAIDLDVVGQTHRAYSDAKEAVRNRKPPQKPPEVKDKEPFDQERWLREQMALTSDLNARYNTPPPKPPKPPKPEKGEPYVPKPRKTQRAKQKPRGRAVLSAYAHGTSDG